MFMLHEQSDVFIDACASDHRAQLLFISAYGRDTSIQQLMARIHQRATQGGVDQLTVGESMQARPSLKVLVGDPNRLDKIIGRCPRTSLMGNLVHAWIFDPALLRLDPAIGAGWILEQGGGADPPREAKRLWRMLKELSPVPLLDHWALTVLAHLQTIGAVVRPPCVGPVRALRLELPEDFVSWVSERVRNGDLRESMELAVDRPQTHRVVATSADAARAA